ncbi:MAG: GAF domain-containing protein [Leptolyngbyaceae cyanobacterium SU_3_3]|nr:GAF domain-containing protein [Leptolyngbyaceae cyanobacterium SU_3_3]
MQTAVTETCNLLKVDRVLVYRFEQNSLAATVIAESVTSGNAKVISQVIHDPLGLKHVGQYNTQLVRMLNDVSRQDIHPHHRAHLEHLQAKAEMVALIKQDDRVIGLLGIYQSSESRQWQRFESDF